MGEALHSWLTGTVPERLAAAGVEGGERAAVLPEEHDVAVHREPPRRRCASPPAAGGSTPCVRSGCRAHRCTSGSVRRRRGGWRRPSSCGRAATPRPHSYRCRTIRGPSGRRARPRVIARRPPVRRPVEGRTDVRALLGRLAAGQDERVSSSGATPARRSRRDYASRKPRSPVSPALIPAMTRSPTTSGATTAP